MAEKIEKPETEWQKQLSPEQYYVTRKAGTEPAFSGKYWKTKDAGTYACVCCGQPLFSSETKFDSGTGWPSFLEAGGRGRGGKPHRQDLRHGSHRDPLRALQCPPGACFRRRPGAHRPALLYEFGGSGFEAGRKEISSKSVGRTPSSAAFDFAFDFDLWLFKQRKSKASDRCRPTPVN